MTSRNIPLINQPRINGKERFRQQRSEGDDEYRYDHLVDDVPGYYDNKSKTFLPTYRDAVLAQIEYSATGMREKFTTNKSCICAGCNCNICKSSYKKGIKCTGCNCPNCNCKVIPENLYNRRKEHFIQYDNSYTTDPRFLVGTAELHFNVGSDVNDITRVYGTVDQKRYYPKLSNYINYGVASLLETSK